MSEIPANGRVRLRSLPSGDGRADLAREVRAGLTQPAKHLPCRYFYDHVGSQLFRDICALPEYYLWRAEDEILAAHAAAIAASVPAASVVVELGSGSGEKTQRLLAAQAARGARVPGARPRYAMVDISSDALRASSGPLAERFSTLEVDAVCADFAPGIALLAAEKDAPWLVLWLGSTVGNLSRADAARFLGALTTRLERDDRLLLGVDLRKDPATLVAAYDDAQGVTARFNQNLLARVNAELGGRFDLDAFRHVASYDENDGRISMHLESAREQRVRIDALELEVRFARGERIHTEDSYKYSAAEIEELARAAGLEVQGMHLDAAARFASVLLARA